MIAKTAYSQYFKWIASYLIPIYCFFLIKRLKKNIVFIKFKFLDL